VTGPQQPHQLSHLLTRFEQQQQGKGNVSNGMITTLFDSQQQQQVLHLMQQHMNPRSITSSFGCAQLRKQQHGNGDGLQCLA